MVVYPCLVCEVRSFVTIFNVSDVFFSSRLQTSTGFSNIAPTAVIVGNLVDHICLKVAGCFVFWRRELLMKGYFQVMFKLAVNCLNVK